MDRGTAVKEEIASKEMNYHLGYGGVYTEGNETVLGYGGYTLTEMESSLVWWGCNKSRQWE